MWSEIEPLTEESIRWLPAMPGAYVLGRVDTLGRFEEKYPGRADEFLPRRLRDHLPGRESNPVLIMIGCTHYRCALATNALEAFRLECGAYHVLMDAGYWLVNINHPAAPIGYECTMCLSPSGATLANVLGHTIELPPPVAPLLAASPLLAQALQPLGARPRIPKLATPPQAAHSFLEAMMIGSPRRIPNA